MHTISMRTTIDLQPDVEKAIQQRRKISGKGLSETVNELLRESLVAENKPRSHFSVNPRPMGARLDVSNVAEVLELIEDE